MDLDSRGTNATPESLPLQVEFRETGKLQPSLLHGFTFRCRPFHGAQQEVFACQLSQEILSDQHANRRTREIAWHWHVWAPMAIGIESRDVPFLLSLCLIGNTVSMAILMTGLEIARM